jgi:hypothetical protein
MERALRWRLRRERRLPEDLFVICQIAAHGLLGDQLDCVQDLLHGECFVEESENESLGELRPVRQISARDRAEDVTQDGLEHGDADVPQGIGKIGRRRF